MLLCLPEADYFKGERDGEGDRACETGRAGGRAMVAAPGGDSNRGKDAKAGLSCFPIGRGQEMWVRWEISDEMRICLCMAKMWQKGEALPYKVWSGRCAAACSHLVATPGNTYAYSLMLCQQVGVQKQRAAH
jgi:hypothetical protein